MRLGCYINDGRRIGVARVVLKIQKNFLLSVSFYDYDFIYEKILKTFSNYFFIVQKLKKKQFFNLKKSSLSHFMSYIKRSQIYMNITTEEKRMNE